MCCRVFSPIISSFVMQIYDFCLKLTTYHLCFV